MKKEILAVMAVVMVAFGGCAVGEDGVGETYEVSEGAGTSGVDGGESEVMSLAESMAESMFESRLESMEEGLTETTAESTAVTTVRVVETEEETSVWTDEDSKSVIHTFYRRSEDESRTVTIESDVFPYDCEEMTICVDSDWQRFMEAEGYEYIDLGNLKNYPNLKKLEIGDSNGVGGGGDVKIINGSGAAGLENLEEIELYNCTWWEEDWLSGVGSLKRLSIEQCREYDGVFLENLTQVEKLSIYKCPISDVSFINGMDLLSELTLDWVKLDDTSFDGLEENYSLKSFSSNESSHYSDNGDVLTNIMGVSKLRGLEYLYIGSGFLADEEKQLEELQELLPACVID